MKPVWGLIAFSILFSVAGLVMIFKGKVEVDPQRVLNPTNFSRPEEIGAVVFRRFWNEINSEKIVVLASSPFLKDYDRVWKGFLSVAREYNVTFREIFSQDGLRPIFDPLGPAALGLAASAEKVMDWEKIQIAAAGDGHVLVHVVATDEMWKTVSERILSGVVIFQSLLPVRDDVKALLQRSCPDGDKSGAGVHLDCLALKALSHGKRKKFDVNKLTATLEKQGPESHVLFIHEPEMEPR